MDKIKAIFTAVKTWIIANKKIAIPAAIVLVVVFGFGGAWCSGYTAGCKHAKKDIKADEQKKIDKAVDKKVKAQIKKIEKLNKK